MKCVVLTSDLMLQSQIAQAVRNAGMSCDAVSRRDQLVVSVTATKATLVIVDLQEMGGDLQAAIGELRELEHAPRCIAVGPHVRAELLEEARVAGWQVLTRGQLYAQLPAMLLRA